MSYDTPACPACAAALTHSDDGAFNPWVCPKGHGLAATLSEGYERIDEGELKLLWQRARAADATVGPRSCPMCERPMVVVQVPATDRPELPLDVCTADELLWFDNAELDELPAEHEPPAPTAEQQAHLDQIMATFREHLDAEFEDREFEGFTGRITRHLTGHSPLLEALGDRRKTAEPAD
jgi:Zn-finger nucleic acid-binding protein